MFFDGRFSKVTFAYCITLLQLSTPSRGGETEIDTHSVRLDGYSCDSVVQAGQKVEISYTTTDYSFSGGNEKYEYVLFSIERVLDIKASVGAGGKNIPRDVISVKQILNDTGAYEGHINEDVDATLIDSIAEFQRAKGILPDGRIDPGGPTLRRLELENSNPTLQVQLIRQLRDEDVDRPPNARDFDLFGRSRRVAREHSRRTYEFRKTGNFVAPNVPGEYRIIYYRTPLFTPWGMTESHDTSVMEAYDGLPRAAKFEINSHLSLYGDLWREMCKFRVDNPGITVRPNVTVYLRVNGKTPVAGERIEPGIRESPAIFSWWIERTESVRKVYYRYQLFPEDAEFSIWREGRHADYFFLQTGHHEFRLETRFIDTEGKERYLPAVYYNFTLDRPFLAKPAIKATAVRRTKNEATVLSLGSIYSGSRALIVGVTDYADRSFIKLPYIKEDLDATEEALGKRGFEKSITRLEGRVLRSEVLTEIDRLISVSGENDRIIIYLSSHGFRDKYSESEGYIATSDCMVDAPSAGCLSLDTLGRLTRRAIEKPIKHILIIADSCFSGLGVIEKASTFPDILRISTVQGAHMITGGMALQKAEQDPDLRMSLLAYYLANGLNSRDADYTGDGIITLTELLLFVQYNVALRSNGRQIPMLGRIYGEGEMIFDLRSSTGGVK